MADEKAKEEVAEAPQASGKNPLVAVLLVVNIAALGTVAFFQYKFMEMEAKRPDLTQLMKEGAEAQSTEAAAEAATVEKVKKENLVSLDGFTINLAQGDGPRRFVRLNTVLKM